MKILQVLTLIFLLPFFLNAKDDEEFIKLLDEMTEIATKTKLNIDYVPSVVTVIKGSELEQIGIFVLSELNAFNMISGVDRIVSIRGIGDKYALAKIKLLINSKPINFALTGVPEIPSIPTALIDRIEIIRGPGSAIYGENAYSGVINIITKKETKEAFFTYTLYNQNRSGESGGFNTFFENENLMLNINFSKFVSDDMGINIKKDASFYLNNSYVNRNLENDRVNDFLNLNLNYNNFLFSLIYSNKKSGENFGKSEFLPPNDNDLNWKEEILNLETKKIFNIGKVKLIPKIGYIFFNQKNENIHYVPKGYIPSIYENGLNITANFKEERYYFSLDTFYTKNNHNLLMGVENIYTKLKNVNYKSNFDPLTNEEYEKPIYFTGEKNILKEGISRKSNAIYLQDEWSISEPLTITIGVRWDNYNDVGNSINPRVAGVYRLNDTNILKMQYAKAFKPPTFFDLYFQNNPVYSGNPNMEPEDIDTYEFNYIYNKMNNIVRITLFYSNLKNVIGYDFVTSKLQNLNEAETNGVEIEYIKQFNEWIKLTSNFSIANTKDKITKKPFPNVAKNLANIILNLTPFNDLNFNIWYQYIGKKPRENGDIRNFFKKQHLLNSSLKIDNLSENLSMMIGVNDIFNKKLTYPSPTSSYDDMPYEKRNLWVNLNYKF